MPSAAPPVVLERETERDIRADRDTQAGRDSLSPPEELELRHSAARLLGESKRESERDTQRDPSERLDPAGPRPGVLCSYRPDWEWRDGVEAWKCDRLPPLPPDLSLLRQHIPTRSEILGQIAPAFWRYVTWKRCMDI